MEGTWYKTNVGCMISGCIWVRVCEKCSLGDSIGNFYGVGLESQRGPLVDDPPFTVVLMP